MSNEDLQRVFDSVLTEPRPDTTDIGSAMRAGRRRRRRRITGVVLSSAAVLAAVGIGLAGLVPQPTAPPVGGPSGTSSPAPTPDDRGTQVTSAEQLFGSWWTTRLDGQDVRSARDRSGNPLVSWFGRNDADGTLWWGANDGCNDHGGTVTVSGDGRLLAAGGVSTQVGCIGGVQIYPRNPEVVQQATQARIVAASSTTPRRLVLLADERVIAEYDAVPGADARRRGGTVLVSGPTDDPGSGMAAMVTGTLTLGKDDCLGLDGQSAVFPQGTSWAPALGLLILPDGTTAQLGDILRGGGGYIPSSAARQWVQDPDMRGICSWSEEVRVFNLGSQITVGE